MIQRQLALTRKLDGERSTQYASLLSQYGTLLTQRNEYASAQQVYEQSLQIQEGARQGRQPAARRGRDPGERVLAGQPARAGGRAVRSRAGDDREAGHDDLAARQHAVDDRLALPLRRPRRPRPAAGQEGDRALRGRDRAAGARQARRLPAARADRPARLHLPAERRSRARRAGVREGDRARRPARRVLGVGEHARRGQARAGQAARGARAARGRAGPAREDRAAERAAFNAIIADVAREVGDYPRAERLLAEYRASLEKTYGQPPPAVRHGRAQHRVRLHGERPAGAGRAAARPTAWRSPSASSSSCCGPAPRPITRCTSRGTATSSTPRSTSSSTTRRTAASAARLGLTTLLRRKGRVLDAAAASLTTIRARLSPDDKQLLDDLASARAQLAKLTVAGPSATGDGRLRPRDRGAARTRSSKLEIQLGKGSTAYRAASQPIVLAAVQKAIPRDARLVEIVNFQPWDPRQPYSANQVLGPRRYAAYVAAPDRRSGADRSRTRRPRSTTRSSSSARRCPTPTTIARPSSATRCTR